MLTTKEVIIIAFQSLGSCTNIGCAPRGALISEVRKLVDECWASVLAIGGLLHTAGLTTGQYIPLVVVTQDTLCCEMASERDSSRISCRSAGGGKRKVGGGILLTADCLRAFTHHQ